MSTLFLVFQGKGLVTTYWLLTENLVEDLTTETSRVSHSVRDLQSTETPFQSDFNSGATISSEFQEKTRSIAPEQRNAVQLSHLKDKSCNPHVKCLSKPRRAHVRNRPSDNSNSSDKLRGSDGEQTPSPIGSPGSLNSLGSWSDGQQSPLMDLGQLPINRSSKKKITFITDSESATPLLLNSKLNSIV